MSRRYKSPREALGHMYSFFTGPTWSKQQLEIVQRSTAGNQWDAPMIAVLVYGPRPRCMGVVRGSETDRKLRHWATTKGATSDDTLRSWASRYEKRLRSLMRANDMLCNKRAIRAIFRQHFRFQDAFSGDMIETFSDIHPDRPLVDEEP